MPATTVSSDLIEETISSDTEKAGMLSLLINTTQDITSQKQCSVVLRSVTDTVQERLLAMTNCKDSTGQYFVDLLSVRSTKVSSTLMVHVWCYAHVLNLFMSDTTQALKVGNCFHCSMTL